MQIFKNGLPRSRAEDLANEFVKELCQKDGVDLEKFAKTYTDCMLVVKNRHPLSSNPKDIVDYSAKEQLTESFQWYNQADEETTEDAQLLPFTNYLVRAMGESADTINGRVEELSGQLTEIGMFAKDVFRPKECEGNEVLTAPRKARASRPLTG